MIKNLSLLLSQGIFMLLMLTGCTSDASEPFPVSLGQYLVSSAAEIKELPELVPGDVITMTNGMWTDQKIVIKGNGTTDKPIILRPQTPGQVILNGTSTLSIAGAYLQVEGLIFRDGTVSGNVTEFRSGSSEASHCRMTNITIENYNPSDKNTDSKWVSLYGTNNRVDHCSFSGKSNLGTTLVVWLDETTDHHLIDHNYFGPRPELGQNGGETIRIGTSQWVNYESNTIVEYNLFEACDGETEIVSNKSVGNHYRYNTFRNCDGTLTLRHGSRCFVYGNFFFGGSGKNSGGVRIIGEGHEVYNNYFEGLNGTSYRAALCLMNGIPDSPNNGYVQVRNAKIGFNTIVGCKEPFAIGAGKDSEKTLPPSDCLIANNLISGRDGYRLVKAYDATGGITWSGNMTDMEDLGINPQEGIKVTELLLSNEEGMFRPQKGSVANHGADDEVLKNVNIDIEGQNRPGKLRDTGCDQVTEGAVVNFPLTRKDVGTHYE